MCRRECGLGSGAVHTAKLVSGLASLRIRITPTTGPPTSAGEALQPVAAKGVEELLGPMVERVVLPHQLAPAGRARACAVGIGER